MIVYPFEIGAVTDLWFWWIDYLEKGAPASFILSYSELFFFFLSTVGNVHALCLLCKLENLSDHAHHFLFTFVFLSLQSSL